MLNNNKLNVIGDRSASLLRLPDVKTKIGLSRSTIYSKMDIRSAQFDPLFPRPISLGKRAVAWVEAEIDMWVDTIIEKSRRNL